MYNLLEREGGEYMNPEDEGARPFFLREGKEGSNAYRPAVAPSGSPMKEEHEGIENGEGRVYLPKSGNYDAGHNPKVVLVLS